MAADVEAASSRARVILTHGGKNRIRRGIREPPIAELCCCEMGEGCGPRQDKAPGLQLIDKAPRWCLWQVETMRQPLPALEALPTTYRRIHDGSLGTPNPNRSGAGRSVDRARLPLAPVDRKGSKTTRDSAETQSFLTSYLRRGDLGKWSGTTQDRH